MTDQLLSDEAHQQRYSDAIRSAKNKGDNSFQSWFNRSDNVHQSIVRGFWDFSLHVITPTVGRLLVKPEEKTALEIGYGGGRILNAACHFFKFAHGVDIHNEQKFVNTFLKQQGNDNFNLMRTDGSNIDLDDQSVDFVYSFIVLQHLPTLASLIEYLQETYRILKPNGVAQLYIGKFSKLKPTEQLQHFMAGYKEITDAPVNHTSLVLRVGKMQSLCRAQGFRVVDSGPSYKTVPDGYPLEKGGQNYVTVQK